MEDTKLKTEILTDVKGAVPEKREEIVIVEPTEILVGADDVEPEMVIEDAPIKVEQISLGNLDRNTTLVEITDSKTLSAITQIIPDAAKMVAATANAIIASGDTVYRAVLPAGEELAKSKTADAFRGFFRGENGRVKGHADFFEVDQSVNKALNVTAAAMSVASIVVGQYYMNQINSKLEKIGSKIDKVANFQDDEFKGKVIALVLQIRKISSFKGEILQDEKLCSEKIASLDQFEHKCAELLAQANNAIIRTTNQRFSEYKAYKDAAYAVDGWYEYQQVLIEVLYQIADLEYTLHKGTMSLEQCSSLLMEYTRQVVNTRDLLARWHKENMKVFEVDLSRRTRKRDAIDGVLHFIPGIFDSSQNYIEMSENTTRLYEKQLSHQREYSRKNQGFYAEEVQLISQDGKWYYLAPADKKEVKGFNEYLAENKRKDKSVSTTNYEIREPKHKEQGEYKTSYKKDFVTIANETIYITQKNEYQFNGDKIQMPDANYKEVLVYTPEAGEILLKEDINKYKKTEMCNIDVCNEDSFAAAAKYDKPLVMNFANAFQAGGGFKHGAKAQEEALCRCSTLYASISSPMAVQMYSYNKSKKNPLTSDYMLLSPSVCVFRDKDCELLKEPFMASVITIPAPNRNGEAMHETRDRIEETMKRRIRIMFHIALQKGYTNLILGAWGCGAFGNDPYDVAEYFRTILIDEGYGKCFGNVCFAVLDKEDGVNISAFRECLG